jgi:hypothetical protein
MRRRFADGVLALALSCAALLAACDAFKPSPSEPKGSPVPGPDPAGSGARGGSDGQPGLGTGGDFIGEPPPGGGAPDAGHPGFHLEPEAPQTISVVAGEPMPTLEYTATLNGEIVTAGFSVDRGELGSVSPTSGSSVTFTPTGKAGGLVKVRAGLQDEVIERDVFVRLVTRHDGPDLDVPAEVAQIAGSVAQLTEGGGLGGVGGEGLGGAVTDPATLSALGSPTSNAASANLRLLYPYDATVWPRGLPAPLLMWEWPGGDADAVQIELETTSGSFAWTGTFGRPAILSQTGGAFIRHPIPQSAWAMATNTAGGPTLDGSPDRLVVRVTLAQDGQGYEPLTQTWTVAPARLSGTIYYNSYGTQLARNFDGAVGGDGTFGGAVLSIRAGDPGPELVAGGDGDDSYCRVCHSVASEGSRLVVRAGLGEDEVTVAYDLAPTGATEFALENDPTYSGLTPDGALALGSDGSLLDLNDGGQARTVTGLSNVATQLGTPAFSPDGSRVVFNPMESATLGNPRQKLVVMNFDAASDSFTNPVVVVDDTGSPEETRPGWPAFFPDGASVVFQHQLVAGIDGNEEGALRTRKGAKARIAWTSTTDPTHVTPLNRLNGLDASGQSYLPTLGAPVSMSCIGDDEEVGDLDADHGDDANLNYEPTVSPIPAGGYAWVVFVSRRMYGSVATIPPFCSDPRGVDLIQNVTPKKLWVAAIDLDMEPGADRSHPAFYLPGQELLAGNARGFWVFDPCRPDGDSCETGDQCCHGFCAPDPSEPDGEALICTDAPPTGECSALQDRCVSDADCCDPDHVCINGFCAHARPPR